MKCKRNRDRGFRGQEIRDRKLRVDYWCLEVVADCWGGKDVRLRGCQNREFFVTRGILTGNGVQELERGWHHVIMLTRCLEIEVWGVGRRLRVEVWRENLSGGRLWNPAVTLGLSLSP